MNPGNSEHITGKLLDRVGDAIHKASKSGDFEVHILFIRLRGMDPSNSRIEWSEKEKVKIILPQFKLHPE